MSGQPPKPPVPGRLQIPKPQKPGMPPQARNLRPYAAWPPVGRRHLASQREASARPCASLVGRFSACVGSCRLEDHAHPTPAVPQLPAVPSIPMPPGDYGPASQNCCHCSQTGSPPRRAGSRRFSRPPKLPARPGRPPRLPYPSILPQWTLRSPVRSTRCNHP
jgi:hypothetical protein